MLKYILLAALSSAALFTQAATAAAPACAGEKKCLEKLVVAHLTAELRNSSSQLRKTYAAVVNESAHYECFGEMADPVGEYTAKPDVAVLAGSSADEREMDSTEVTYENEFVASIALPADCNEGGIVHNWYPRLLLKVEVSEKAVEGKSSTRRGSLKIDTKALAEAK